MRTRQLKLKNEINPSERNAIKTTFPTDQLLPPLNEGRKEWEPSASRGGDKRRSDVGGGRCGYWFTREENPCGSVMDRRWAKGTGVCAGEASRGCCEE
jgi:hypothetical protein